MLEVLLISFFALLLLGVPLAYTMGISSLLAILIVGEIPLLVVPQRIIVALDSFPLMAVPLFIMAGEIMNIGGITERIVKFATTLVGHIRGGFFQVTVISSMIFAGISGSASADAAAIGSVLIPGMTKEGYDEDLAVAVTAASATTGPIIPPSIPMIVYSSMTGLSIASLFLSGVVPGILFGLSIMLISYIYACKRGYPKKSKAGVKEIMVSLKGAILPMLAPVIILVGICGGIFTATEAGGVACIYALIIGAFYKRINFTILCEMLLKSAKSTSIVVIIIACASLFGWILAVEQFPLLIVSALTSISANPQIIILLIIAMMLIIGLFIEGLAAMVILVPVMLPLIPQFGFDPLHFAIIVILCLIIGTITPPVGLLLFVVSGVSKISMNKIGFTIWPFIFAMVGIVIIIAYFPQIALFLPSLLQ